MKKVITYGTYDLLHYGHIKLLERAKALGDYLIVGVTSEDFDKQRGKINVQQSLMERVKAVKNTGLADEIIIEEYEGQKIDDICKYGIDIFTVGSDWKGKFDYLKEYCDVVYLPRTQGISSTDLRTEKRKIRLGIVGQCPYLDKIIKESNFVNGIEITSIFTKNMYDMENKFNNIKLKTDNYESLLQNVDAIYILSHPSEHNKLIENALINHKHGLCESPITLSESECEYLFDLARKNDCILMEAIKTAYATAYARMLLLLKGGIIGKIVSIDATCTSLKKFDINDLKKISDTWNSVSEWGPIAMLPIFQILGTKYKQKQIISNFMKECNNFDLFTKINFIYDNAVASIKVGKGVKSEGDLIITGEKGYIYIPAPWWKTDYFEVRYENPAENKRYFYQLDGEGIRYELATFARSIEEKRYTTNISNSVSIAISKVLEDFENRIDIIEI